MNNADLQKAKLALLEMENMENALNNFLGNNGVVGEKFWRTEAARPAGQGFLNEAEKKRLKALGPDLKTLTRLATPIKKNLTKFVNDYDAGSYATGKDFRTAATRVCNAPTVVDFNSKAYNFLDMMFRVFGERGDFPGRAFDGRSGSNVNSGAMVIMKSLDVFNACWSKAGVALGKI